MTKELLRRLTHSGKIYLIPVTIRNKHGIRFTVTSQYTTADDILRDWTVISETAAALLAETTALKEPHPTASGNDAGQEKAVSAARGDNGDASELEKGELEHWIDKKQSKKSVNSLNCNSEPLVYTCFGPDNGRECEDKPRLNSAAAVLTAGPKPGVADADLGMAKNLL